MSIREVDGIKVGFCEHEDYFASLVTPSMYSTSRDTGADVVFLLAPGVKAADLTDDQVREFIAATRGAA